MVEGYLPPATRQLGRLGIGRLLILRKELEDALRRSRELLQHVGHLRQLRDGLREVAYILHERLDVTDGHGAAHGKERAHAYHGNVSEIRHEVHERLHDAREELGTPARGVQAVVLHVEVSHGALLAIEHLDDVLAREALLDDAVHTSQDDLLLPEVALRGAHHDEHEQKRQRNGEERDARKRH